MDSPLVSVIIPAYNAEKYLRRCLDSIFAQTFSDFEIIIINDGSNDHTLDIILSYSELYPGKMRVINKLNGGQGAARNEGMKLARGKYIAFVDADDYVADSFLAELYTKAEEESADIVICNYALVRQSKIVKSVKPKIPKDSKDMLVDPDVVPWKQLWKTKMLTESGVKFAEKVFYEDTAFYLMIAPSIKKIAAVNKELYYYVDNGASTVHGKQDKKVGHIFEVMNQVYDYYEKNGLFKTYQDELEYAYVKILLCSQLRLNLYLPQCFLYYKVST